jgi:hypothetical protein
VSLSCIAVASVLVAALVAALGACLAEVVIAGSTKAELAAVLFSGPRSYKRCTRCSISVFATTLKNISRWGNSSVACVQDVV